MMLDNWSISYLLLITIILMNLSIGAHCQERQVVAERLLDQVTPRNVEHSNGLECLLDKDVVECLTDGLGRNVGQIESDSTAESYDEPSTSTAIEDSARLLAEFVHDLHEPPSLPNESPRVHHSARIDERSRSLEQQARKKKFGKKKKKHLQKLLGLAMLLKAKISLLLQLISTHFQLKFFVLAIVNLILNAAKFWLDLKKSHPSKVIYYEHAQHQHHYDHDDHDHSGYWARSANSSPEALAYSAYKPTDRL